VPFGREGSSPFRGTKNLFFKEYLQNKLRFLSIIIINPKCYTI